MSQVNTVSPNSEGESKLTEQKQQDNGVCKSDENLHRPKQSGTVRMKKIQSVRTLSNLTRLLFYARDGDHTKINEVLTEQKDPDLINFADYDQRTMLHLAAAEGQV